MLDLYGVLAFKLCCEMYIQETSSLSETEEQDQTKAIIQ